MNKKHHQIYDSILKIIITVYLSEFLEYIGRNRRSLENRNYDN
ncbi:hypothetical protein [uncultured Methanobrevibacter sp.]|nr:hypothetical protein [uncultured Methanobrevibacter sp.]